MFEKLSAGQVLHCSSTDYTRVADFGSTVSFDCKSNTSSPIRWKYLAPGNHSRREWIYTGVKFVDHWSPRHRSRAEFDESTGTGLLSIADVQESDSGQYFCLNTGKGDTLFSFDLLVTSKMNFFSKRTFSSKSECFTFISWRLVGYFVLTSYCNRIAMRCLLHLACACV